MLKRGFDILASWIGLLILSPFFIFISIAIIVNSGFPIFYRQVRIGKNEIPFQLLKFRTMRKNADKLGLLTVGGRDPRVTPIGYYLRKYKLDELPQLINVLKGDMSLVGPRPEVKKYVEMYTPQQKLVLTVRPGITDLASIRFVNENEILSKSNDPEKTYIEEIMPLKLRLNMRYISSKNFFKDIFIILETFKRIVS